MSTSAQAPNPAFPVGWITAVPVQVVQAGTTAELTWSIELPDGENPQNYAFFIRQTAYPDMWVYEKEVAQSGQTLSMSGGAGGSSFELWVVSLWPLSSQLVDSTFCANYFPTASVSITSQDPYSALPRTRADRPFTVDITTGGVQTGEEWPAVTQGVTLVRHVQAYGSPADAASLDRTQATLLDETSITTNGTQTTTSLHAIPATESTKAMGEQRYTVMSLADPETGTPAAVISSRFVQVWPVADATIGGISAGQTIGPQVPNLSLQLRDLYPESATWAQVYLGSPRPSVSGTMVPGTGVVIRESGPVSTTLQVTNYGSVFHTDGPWTLEILTQTPFGIDRVAAVSFTVQGKGMMVDGWRQTHFGSTANSGDGADLHDFDADSIPNLVEFALGLDPKQSSNASMPKPQRVGDELAIEFTKPSGIMGVLYEAEWSPNLQPGSWEVVPNTGSAPQHSFRLPMDAETKAFMRLKVSRQ